MPFRDYVTALQTLLATTSFVTATALSYEERPPTAGLIKGWLVFADGSQLDFKEFLLTRPTLQVIKYGYHYRAGQRLLFRYDNANDPAARHLPTLPHHKHTPRAAAHVGLTRPRAMPSIALPRHASPVATCRTCPQPAARI